MSIIEQIAQPIEAYRAAFEQEYARAFATESPIVAQAIEKINSAKGKHVRPILVGLMAALEGPEPNNQTVSCAVLLEMLHMASLIHDDVIDQASTRRGVPTLNTFYDNHAAVLVGDYILSIAFLRAIETGGADLMRTAAKVGKQLSEGELLQIQTAKNQLLSEDTYFSIIEKKTAALFEACAALGVHSVGASPQTLLRALELGRRLGIAFQLRDDIFDYTPGMDVGKPTGNDLREGKVTLPLIHVYSQADELLKQHIQQLLDHVEEQPQAITELIDLARQQGGVEYAQLRLDSEVEAAIDILRSFPNSPARVSLIQLAEYLAKRSY